MKVAYLTDYLRRYGGQRKETFLMSNTSVRGCTLNTTGKTMHPARLLDRLQIQGYHTV